MADMFSLPNPLPPAKIEMVLPGTISVYTTAGVLSPVLTRSITGSDTTDFRR